MASKIATKTDIENGVRFEFSTGDVLEASLTELPEDIRLKLAIHGLKQKLGDAYAGAEPEEAPKLASDVYASLREGKWTTRVPGSGGSRVTQLARALAEAAGQPVEAAMEKVESMSEDERKALRKHPRVKAILARYRAEAAAKAAERAKAEGEEAPALPI